MEPLEVDGKVINLPQSKLVLGIDPGLTGAMAWVDRRGALIEIEDMPVVANEVNYRLLSLLIPAYGRVEFAVVEKQQPFPKQGISSAFKLGACWGMILGILTTYEIPIHEVTSAVWKKSLGLGRDKNLSRKLAMNRWPQQADLFKRVKDDGRAEAALMAVAVMGDPHTAPQPRRVIQRRPLDADLA